MNQSQLPGIDILLMIAVAAVLIGIVFYTRRPPKIRVGKSNITAQDSASILKLFADDTRNVVACKSFNVTRLIVLSSTLKVLDEVYKKGIV